MWSMDWTSLGDAPLGVFFLSLLLASVFGVGFLVRPNLSATYWVQPFWLSCGAVSSWLLSGGIALSRAGCAEKWRKEGKLGPFCITILKCHC